MRYKYCMPELLPVSNAARELGVNPARVRALIASGALAAEKVSGVWLVDRASVAGRRHEQASAGRPLAARNAWALLLEASGDEVPADLGPSGRWRIRQALEVYGLGGLRSRLARRAQPSFHWALPGELRALRERDDVALGGASAAASYDLGLVGGDVVDVYVRAGLAERVMREHALQPVSGAESNVVLRVVPDEAWLLDGRRVAPLAAVALDLWAYPEPRASRVGDEVIARLDHDRRAA